MGRIGAQVDEDLVNLRGISQNRVPIGGYLLTDFNAGGNGCPYQFYGFLHERDGVEGLHLGFSLAAETEELANDVLCPETGPADLLKVLMGRVPFRHVIHGQLRVSQDNTQNIVEIVGNSA